MLKKPSVAFSTSTFERRSRASLRRTTFGHPIRQRGFRTSLIFNGLLPASWRPPCTARNLSKSFVFQQAARRSQHGCPYLDRMRECHSCTQAVGHASATVSGWETRLHPLMQTPGDSGRSSQDFVTEKCRYLETSDQPRGLATALFSDLFLLLKNDVRSGAVVRISTHIEIFVD